MYKILKLTHEQWLVERKKGIGSSEVGVLMGLSHYANATPLKLWRLKTGRQAPEPETPAMLRGHMFEDVVAQYFVLRTGAAVDPGSKGDFLAVDTEKPWLRVSPDRICWTPDIPAEQRTLQNCFILECKTTTRRILKGRDGKFRYPETWYAQVQYQMGVMGVKKAAICWLVLGADEDQYVWVDFNPVFYREMVKVLDRFWKVNILGDTPPEEIVTDDDAKLRWPLAIEGKKAIANTPLMELIARRNKVQEMYTVVEKEKKDCDMRIRTAMGDIETLMDAEGNIVVTYRNGEPRTDFNKAAFAKDHPDLYVQYCQQSSSRTLRFRKVGDTDAS